MTVDGMLGLVGIILALSVGVVALRQPETIRKEYEKHLQAVRQELREVGTELDRLEVRYRELATEYLRIIGENHWLRLQLRQQNIEIPPLPDDLKPRVDSAGNISIMVSGASGGIQVSGSKLNVGGDVAARDKKGGA